MFYRILRSCVLCLAVVFSLMSQATAGTIYWTEENGHALRAADLDGLNVRDAVSPAQVGEVFAIDRANATMYWADGDAIVNSDLTGENATVLISFSQEPTGMAIDLVARKLYWTGPQTDRIERINLDGTGLETVVVRSGSANPFKIVVDSSRNKMYWTEYGTDSLLWADLDGSTVEVFQTPPSGHVTVLALDPASGNVYWSNTTTGSDSILRSDPSGITETLRDDLVNLGALFFDPSSNQLYWTEQNDQNHELIRGDVNAANAVQVDVDLSGYIHQLSSDLNGKLYWAIAKQFSMNASIQRIDQNGGNVEVLVGGWLEEPRGLVVDLIDRRLYWLDRHGVFSKTLNLGSLPRVEFSVNLETHAIAVDKDAGHVFSTYFCEGGASIWRFNGISNVQVISGLECPGSIAIDDVANKIYFYDYPGILRANLNGTSLEVVLAISATALALDPPNGKIYFAVSNGTIRSANLDGTEPQDLVLNTGQVRGLALDDVNDKMYWTAGSSVYRANTDGTDAVELVTGLDTPWGIGVSDVVHAAIPATSTWTFLVMVSCVLALGTALLRRRCRAA